MSIRDFRPSAVSRDSLARGGRQPGAGAYQRAIGERTWRESEPAREVFLTELRVHGRFGDAALAAGLGQTQIHKWSRQRAGFGRAIELAKAFAQSGELSYTDWLRKQVAP